MSEFKVSLTLILLFLCFNKIFSQDDSPQIKLTDKNNKNDSTLIPFWEEQSDWFRNSEIPSFVFVSPGRKFSLGIGGYVNLTASYDFDGIVDNIDFVPFDINIPNNSFVTDQYQMYANTSLVYFKIVQKTSNGNLVGYLSSNFRGEGNTLGIFQVYVKYMGIEFGQDWSSFTDVASWPTTVNYLALNSMPEVLNPLIKYSKKFKDGWQFGISAEMPDFTTAYENTLSLNQNTPDIPGYLQYSFDKSHLRLSGIFRNLLYRDTLNNNNESVIGTGISLTGNINITKKAQVYFQGLIGKGLGQYVEDLTTDELNVVPDSDNPGMLDALPVYSYYGALQYNFSPDLFAGIMYSQVKVQPDNFSSPSFYSYSSQITANVFWNFLPSAQLGLEYCRGRRVNQNGEKGNANRAEFMMQYNF